MSSTSMDISENFRPEDLSKTDFFDFVTAPDLDISIDRPPAAGSDSSTNGSTEQALQGYDQFWGAEKDTSRLESAIFEDLNRYCWSQQNNSGAFSNQTGNTDGQIYTLTVLNGTEPWLRIDNTPDQPSPALDFDSMLGNGFPSYVKTEYTYDESGFTGNTTTSSATDVHIKDELGGHVVMQQQQHLQQQQQQQQIQDQQEMLTQTIIITNNNGELENTGLTAFQDNNNDWHMVDHNAIQTETSESLLRSALQGKGYTKGLQLNNGITIIPVKTEDEMRNALYTHDQDNLSFVESPLATPLYDDSHIVDSPISSSSVIGPILSADGSPSMGNIMPSVNNSSSASDSGAVDDMFLTLDATFSEDYEKIKRIASEVQQFCITSGDASYNSKVVLPDVSTIQQRQPHHQQQQQHIQQHQPPIPSSVCTTPTTVVEVSTTIPTLPPIKSTKKQKKINNNNNNNNNNLNHNNNNSILANNNNSITTANNNTNSSNSTSHNSISSPNQCSSINNNNSSSSNPTNGQQRKERSLHYCSICSKGFKDKYSVNVHIRTHTGEKPFACSLCGKSFRQKAHLAKHYQTHLAQKNPSAVTKGGSKQSSAKQQQQQLLQQQQQTTSDPSSAALPQQLPQQHHQPLPPIQALSSLPKIASVSSNGMVVLTANR